MAAAAIPSAKSDDLRTTSVDVQQDMTGNLLGHGGPVKAVQLNFTRDRVLSGSFDYTMMYWDLSGAVPKQTMRFDDHDGAVNAVLFLPDGRHALSAGDDGIVRQWELESGRLVRRFEGHTAKIVGLAVSADGRIAASAGWDRTVRIWHLDRGDAGPVLKGHSGQVNAVVIVEMAAREGSELSGLTVFSASTDGTIRAWSGEDGRFIRVLYRHGWGINVMRALTTSLNSATEPQLFFGSLNGQAGVVDPRSGEPVKMLKEHEGPVLSLALLEKPGLAATGGGDGRIRVWRADDWKLLEEHQNPYGPIWAMDFSRDGREIYYGGLDDFVIRWQVRPRKPFESIISKFPRRFQVDSLASLGERQFARKCSVCHTLQPDGKNRAGPTLYKLFGRRAGTLPGYPYSNALKHADIVWNAKTIAELFTLGPEHYTPGTKMPLQKIADTEKREALIAFLAVATEPNALEHELEDGAGDQ